MKFIRSTLGVVVEIDDEINSSRNDGSRVL